jgi:two-component system chemotaxis response regulator CheY
MSKSTILIADGAVFMRDMLVEALASAGYVCVEAANGQEAIVKYQSLRPALALLDLTMPLLGGLEAARQILALDSDARLVVYGHIGDAAALEQAVQLGAADFLVKPFEAKDLVTIIGKVLEARSAPPTQR